MKSVLDFDLDKKVVILRCDLNVSVKDGKIADNTRIINSIETIKYILDNNAKVVILSHLGKVKSEEDKSKKSLKIVFDELDKLLPGKLKFVPFTSSDVIKEEIDNISFGSGILLENTRFEDIDGKRESSCDLELAKYWASLGDIFINDAFGTLHRGHASNVGISNFLPSGIGFLVKKEITELDKLDNPSRPFVVIMGGSKVSDKLSVIDKLIEKVDHLLIGGAMSFTFLKALGYEIGSSMYEDDYIEYCKSLLSKYSEKIVLPVDYYGAVDLETSKELKEVGSFDRDFCGYDIGDKTISLFKEKLNSASSIFWNGPLGVYENRLYQTGTYEVMKYLVSRDSYNILGGGDIVSCANLFGLEDEFNFISTGGGASLEYLVDKNLVGLSNIDKVGE